MLRINPDNPCEIQILNCTTGNWDVYQNAEDCGGKAVTKKVGQQTDTTPIAPSGCRDYDIVMSANQQYLLPVPLSTGDTITITALDGAANDGTSLLGVGVWHIPNGGVYRGFLGNENDNTELRSDNPLPDAFHMSLIMNIGGSWYTAYNADSFSVPADIIQDNLIFMVNDSNIADNQGDYKFKVSICKSATLPYAWSHDFDWTNSELPETPFYGTGFSWSAGVGFVGGITDNKLKFDTPDASTKIKYIEAWYNPGLEFAAQIDEGIYADGTTIALTPDLYGSTAAVGNHFIYNLSSNDTHYSYIVIYWHAPGSPKPNGTLYKVRIAGVGVDPFA